MHAASREALAKVAALTDETVANDANAVATGAQAGMELFEVVSVLDDDRTLRFAIGDDSLDVERRAGTVDRLFGGKIAEPTLAILKGAATQRWSSTRDMRNGLITAARRALLRSAEAQGQLAQVEDELFQLARLLDREGQLTQLLSDRTAESSAKRGLLADVLYGKVTMITEALALQVIGRPENNPIDDISAVSHQAAELQGKEVAYVVAAGELNEGQLANLAEKLGRIYGREMSIHTEVDPSLLGGMIIRVGDEVIDGSTRTKIDRTRTALV